VRDEVDDTDMAAAEFRAARDRGTPTQVVRSREEFDAHSRHGGAAFEVYEDRTGKFRLDSGRAPVRWLRLARHTRPRPQPGGALSRSSRRRTAH
jgi:hypothetical protein